jgi:hypothetical protein
MFAGSVAFIRTNLFLIPAITLFASLQVLVSAFAMLALSSMTKNRRFVAMMYAGIIFFTAAMSQALRAITGSTAWGWLSPQDSLGTIADRIFRVPGPPAMPLPVAVAAVIGIIAASIWIVSRRVRGVEVVA